MLTDIELQEKAADQEPRTKAPNMLLLREVIDSPSPDYFMQSLASLFICFAWGVFAFLASNRTRKLNKAGNYEEARRWSRETHRLYKSSIGCFSVTVLIFGIPSVVALATQGDIRSYPSARIFFG